MLPVRVLKTSSTLAALTRSAPPPWPNAKLPEKRELAILAVASAVMTAAPPEAAELATKSHRVTVAREAVVIARAPPALSAVLDKNEVSLFVSLPEDAAGIGLQVCHAKVSI